MSSVPEAHPATKETVADPAAMDPTTTASETSKDPIRPTGTNTLVPESRPEVTGGAAATEPAVEPAPKGTVVVQSQPINEGTLNYKAPGLVKGLIFSKKHFWFGDEPLEQKHLSGYLSNEKPDLAHPNAAHATQTGKGLLFYAKRAEDKPHPAGILNLGEISDFEKGNVLDFSFKIHGHKYTFQAPTRAERDGWLVAIDTRSAAAKEAHEGLVGSEGYKSSLDKFVKSASVAGATGTSRSVSRPKKAVEPKKTSEAKHTDSKATEPKSTETKPAETAAAEGATSSGSSSDEAKPQSKNKSKSRSQSRKRSSIFGTLLGKKEEHDEKKEVKKESKEEKKEIKNEQKAEDKAVKQDVGEKDQAVKKAEKGDEKLEKEAKPTEATAESLDATAIASRVVGAPLAKEGETSPVATGTSDPQAATTAPTSDVPSTEAAATTAPREAAPKASKRGSIFGNFFNKKEATTPIATEAAPAAPGKDNETAVASPTSPQLEKSANPTTPAGTGTTSEPTASTGNSPAAAATSPQNPDTAKPARRTSFFNNLGTKKEKKTDAVSDAEGTDGEGKKSATSKLGGLFRKPSRATPGASAKTESSSNNAPAPNNNEAPAATNGEVAPESTSTTEPQQTAVQASA